ncbi:MAG: dicarboxylate transporter subunit DctM [candidate division NC10 bacterium]|nr:dicarboxylate transporter subunit DctM [candidate division NC10 bacterium]
MTHPTEKTFALPADATPASGGKSVRAGGSIIGRIFDRTCETLVVLGLVISLLATILQVVARYVFNSPVTWSEELSRFVFIWSVFLGAGVMVRYGGHVSVDSLIAIFPKWMQRGTWLLSNFVMGATCVTLIAFGWQIVYTIGSLSPAMRMPLRLFYASVPVGALLVLINLIRGQSGSFRERLRDGVVIIAASGLAFWIFIAGGIEAPAWDPGTVVGLGVIALILLGLVAVPHQMMNGVDSFILLAVPFFLLAGQFMNEGGITERLVALATNLVGHITGGLAHVNILASFLIGGLSGSAAGDAAGLTKVLVPEMERRGYHKEFCCAVTANAAVIDNLIPPAATMMIYGAVASVSVPRIFLAGIVPGMVLTLGLMVAAQVMSIRRGYKGLEHRATGREMARSLKGAGWAIPMPFMILGGMRAGVVTPTEAAGVAVVYAFLVGAFVYKQLKMRDLPRILLQAGMETCMVMLILGASQPFGWVLTAEQIPQQAAEFVTSLSGNPLVVLMLLNVFLLIVGLPLEANPAIIILVPILGPIIQAIGVDPVHFAIIVILNLMLGSVTPPVGILVFVTSTIAGASPGKVFRECVPFLVAGIVVLLIVTYVPALSLFLPDLLMGVSAK